MLESTDYCFHFKWNFLGIFYLAITNQPHDMPSQQTQQNSQQHAFKNAPAMSEEAMAKAQADKKRGA